MIPFGRNRYMQAVGSSSIKQPLLHKKRKIYDLYDQRQARNRYKRTHQCDCVIFLVKNFLSAKIRIRTLDTT